MNNALGSLESEIQFFKQKLAELKKKYTSNSNGFILLTKRLEELIRVYELYQDILDKLTHDKIDIESYDPTPNLTKEDLLQIDDIFDPEIKQVEDEIIDFYTYDSAYSTLEEFTLQVFVYFHTRRVLTQEKIRFLTGLSLGKVSEIVNFLIEMQVIEKLNRKQLAKIIPDKIKRQQIYALNSIQKSFFKSALKSGDRILQYKTKFEEFKNELISGESKLKTLNGYDNVLRVLDNYFKLISLIEKVGYLFEELS
jgi:hypothetical protein